MTPDPTESGEEALLRAEQSLDQRDLGRALLHFDVAEALGANPDSCSAGRWMASMLRGEFALAWNESDRIRRRGAPDPHRFWNGEDIRGKRLIVRCLHGFGDAVQFLRYAPALCDLAAEVIVEVAPRFVELARCLDSVGNVITWGVDAPHESVPWDVQMEVMELPYFFRTQLADLPVAERYLHLPPHLVERVAHEIRQCSVPKVGLVWNSGVWNPSRSVPRQVLAPLFESSDCEFLGLEAGNAEPPCDSIREAECCRDSILALAAAISQLDLLLTVDTLAAHLAGVLAVPGWVMLPYAADWRWMTGTSRSPWYPSLRLFRQPRPGDWASLVAEVRRCLQAWSNELSTRLIA